MTKTEKAIIREMISGVLLNTVGALEYDHIDDRGSWIFSTDSWESQREIMLNYAANLGFEPSELIEEALADGEEFWGDWIEEDDEFTEMSE